MKRRFKIFIPFILLLLLLGGCAQKSQKSDTEFVFNPVKSTLANKLSNSERIEVLIIGDSIGANSGSSHHQKRWDTLFSSEISKKYESPVGITNVSVSGTSSLFGIIKINQIEDIEKFDLAIICYGQNDSETMFAETYEALVRHLKIANPKMDIIPVIESTLKDSEKKQIIESVCEHYNLLSADTVQAFDDSGKDEAELTKDSIHPNDDGYALYAEEVFKVMKSRVLANQDLILPVKVLNDAANRYGEFSFIDLSKMNKEGRKFVSSIDCTVVGSYYNLAPDGGKFSIVLNDEKYDRNNYLESGTIESFELLSASDNNRKLNVELSFDDNVSDDEFFGLFYFSKSE